MCVSITLTLFPSFSLSFDFRMSVPLSASVRVSPPIRPSARNSTTTPPPPVAAAVASFPRVYAPVSPYLIRCRRPRIQISTGSHAGVQNSYLSCPASFSLLLHLDMHQIRSVCNPVMLLTKCSSAVTFCTEVRSAIKCTSLIGISHIFAAAAVKATRWRSPQRLLFCHFPRSKSLHIKDTPGNCMRCSQGVHRIDSFVSPLTSRIEHLPKLAAWSSGHMRSKD